MKEIYLDNSATTKVDPLVAQYILKVMEEDYGNAASLHKKGVDAEKYVRESRERIAATLKVSPDTIFFTSGGTESNNWAVFGAARANHRKGKHLITTPIEHPSIKNPMRELEGEGFEITYLPVDKNGKVSLEDLKKALRPDTILVSIMMVNNEIGTREPVEEIGDFLSGEYPDVIFHVDAIQAYGKYRIQPKKHNISLLSVSSHKLHGPKGMGFLYINERTKINPFIFGGGQQKGKRSGTENVPGAAGMGLSAKLLYDRLDDNVKKLRELKERLLSGIETLDGITVNGKTDEDSAPHILSVSFDSIRSEVLLHALEEKGIYVSSGSACASSHPSEVNTLLAIGLPKESQEGTLRFSLCAENTFEEMDETVAALREILPVLRRFTRK